MLVKIIRDWLAEYKTLTDAEINTYANTILQNADLMLALHDFFEGEPSHESCAPVCHQLFDFYTSGPRQLRQFAVDLLPSMISCYLTAASRNQVKKSSPVASCLLGIYNLESVDAEGKARSQAFTIPCIASPSIFHEPPTLSTLALTETTLQRYHDNRAKNVNVGPLPQVDCLCAATRLPVLTHMLGVYNAGVTQASANSHLSLCRLCSRVAKTGFDSLGKAAPVDGVKISNADSPAPSVRSSSRGVQFQEEARIPVSPALLIELLNGLYFIMFNGHVQEAMRALELIQQRACYELYSDVLLVTNAVINSLQFNPSGQPDDGPMGISIALSTSQSTSGVKKDAITNASFRAKKLPDDIESPDVDDQHVAEVDFPEDPLLKRVGSADKATRKTSLDGLKRLASFGRKRKESLPPETPVTPEVDTDPQDRYKNLPVFRVQQWDDDIEAVEYEDGTEPEGDVPPSYEEIHANDAASAAESDSSKKGAGGIGSALKKTKPLKSIMKKSSARGARKDAAENRRSRELTDGHSPKHSVSMSAGLSSTYDAPTDPSMVKVKVVRSSSSRTIVDKVPTSQAEETPLMPVARDDAASHSTLISKHCALNGNESTSSSNTSLHTAL